MKKHLTPAEFGDSISDKEIRSIQLLTFVFAFPVALFLVIIAALYWVTTPDYQPENPMIANVLTLATLAFSFFSVPLSRFTLRYTINSTVKHAGPFLSIKNAILTRIAVYEGAALLGLVTLMYCILMSDIYYSGVYWINLLPVFFMFFFLKSEFPDREKLREMYNEYIYGA